MNSYKTNYVALLGIAIIASIVTFFIISKISYETVVVEPITKPIVKSDDSIAAFNELVAQGWKVYRDEEKNIEFAYPSDWRIKNSDTSSLLIVSGLNQDLDFYLGLDKNGNAENLSLDNFIKNNMDEQSLYQVESKKIKIGDVIADYRLTYPSKSETLYETERELYNHIFITVIKGSWVYTISGEQISEVNNQYETQFNQILSSFHFLK